MSYQFEVKEQPTQKTLSIRTRAAVRDLPQVFGEGYGKIAQYLDELGEQPIGPPFAAYYNMDMDNLDVEFGFPVARPLPGRTEIKAGEIPGSRVATCLHIGPYSEMEPAYTALTKWMEDNGYEGTGVSYELYLNDPHETPPAQTQIIFPLKNV
jgi:effector-binding domain-containing protein